MKIFKRTLSLALVALVAATAFAACGKAPASSEKPSSSPSSPAAPSGVAGIEGWKPFDEKVKISVPVYDRSKEGYPAVDDNYWTKWIQKEFGDKYNIEVKYIAIPRNDVMTKYSLLIAGEETPTIMMEYDYPKVAQWATDGAMQPIDLDAFKQVAPNFYQAMVDNNQLNYTEINNETFFVLTERPYYNADYVFAQFVRMDWMKQVGINEVPKTYEEQKKAMTALKEAGLTDAPLPLGIPATAYVENFVYRDYPVDEAEWAMHSSLGTASLSWEPTKKFLQRKNEEYNAGWYSKEFDLEKDSKGAGADQLKTNFINGQTYRYGGYMSANVDWLTAFYEKNPTAELAIESVFVDSSSDKQQLRANNPFGMIVGFSSLADENQLKAAWMLMEWMLQDDVLFTLENGIEGVTYKMGEDGLPIVDGAYRGEEMLNHNMNIDMTCLVHASKKLGTIEQSIQAIVPQGLPQNFYDQILNRYNELIQVADAGRTYSDPIFAVTINSEAEYSATLLSLYQEAFAKIVKAAPADFEKVYEQYSKEYLDAGYQEIIDERKKAYDEGMCTKLPK